MRNLVTITLILWIFTSQIKGQDLLMLSNGFTNGKIQNGDSLDALVKNGDFYELKPTKIVVDSIFNPAWNAMQTVYKHPLLFEPIIFFKNHKFKSQEISGAKNETGFVNLDTIVSYSIGDNRYRISSKGTLEHHDSYIIIKDYEIVINALEDGTEHLYSLIKYASVQITNKNFIEAPKLIWIGDLDGDNKLDFIMSENTHYAMFNRSIYLSKDCNKGKYLKSAEISCSID